MSRPVTIEFAGGRVRARGNPDNAVPFSRLAAASHWSPGLVPEENQALRETVFWTPPELTAPTEQDEINSSLCHGFIFDFCGVEIDRDTGAVRIDKYVTMHDCGRILHPGMVAGQITGGFAHAVGAALYEEFAYGAGRQLSHRHLRRLSGADHDGSADAGHPAHRDALAVHAARRQGRRRRQLHEHAGLPRQCGGRCARRRGDRPAADAGEARRASARCRERAKAPVGRTAAISRKGRALRGSGQAHAYGDDAEAVWAMLLDPKTLAVIIPGCHSVEKLSDTHFRAEVTLGVGPVSGRYKADITLSDLDRAAKR